MNRFRNWLKQYKLFYRAEKVIEQASSICPLLYRLRDYSYNRFLRIFLRLLVTPYYVIFRYFLGRKDIPGREGLALVLIAKNEATYIKEWLDFHIKQGVSNFIIYDNESTDNFREVLSPYIKAGIVIYNVIRGKSRQFDAYNMAMHKYRSKFKYMGFIDADEFVFVRNNTYGGGGAVLI